MKSKIVLALDVSTTTIGVALLEAPSQKLLKLTHITPKVPKKNVSKTEEHFLKADLFKEFIQEYKDLGITDVIIETPLMGSNNIYTVATLLKYNGIISKICYDELKVVPDYISTSDARRNAFPDLVQPRKGKNGFGKPTLFGGFPTDVDKKMVIFEKVSEKYKNLNWPKTKNDTLKKECFDMSDAICAGLGWFRMKGY